MKIDDSHRLVGNNITHFNSPFHNERPDENDISLLVIHCISLPPGQFGGNSIHELFMGTLDTKEHPYFGQIKELGVSAHTIIHRTGELIQYVPFNLRAWHAGNSSFNGREKCNDFSIGIELEGLDTIHYESIQYEKLITLTKCIQKRYPAITNDRIVGHCDIAPERKLDPGPAFDWDHYKKKLR